MASKQGRQERPIDPGDGPLAAFAIDLRRLRERCGHPTYRQLATWSAKVGSPYSDTTFSTAARGHTLPSGEVVSAYVRACLAYAKTDERQTERLIAEWTTRRDALETALQPGPTPQPTPQPSAQPAANPAGPTEPGPTGPTEPGPAGPPQPDPAGPTAPSPTGPAQPDPVGPTEPSPAEAAAPDPVRSPAPGHVVPTEPSPGSTPEPGPGSALKHASSAVAQVGAVRRVPDGSADGAARALRFPPFPHSFADLSRRGKQALAVAAGLAAGCGLVLAARYLAASESAAADPAPTGQGAATTSTAETDPSASPVAVTPWAPSAGPPQPSPIAGGLGGNSRCGRTRWIDGVAWAPCTRADGTTLVFAVRVVNAGPDPVIVRVKLAYVRAAVAHGCPGSWGHGVQLSLAPGQTVTSPLTECTVAKLPATAFQAKSWVITSQESAWGYREMSPTVHIQPDGRTPIWADEA
ncbi:hypothetical protein [Streptomyces sp. NPDC001450]